MTLAMTVPRAPHPTSVTRLSHDDRITEVAVVEVKNGRATTVFDTLINPQRVIPPWVSRLTNISAEMVKAFITSDEYVNRFGL